MVWFATNNMTNASSHQTIPKHPAMRSAHECLAENHDMLMRSILQCLQVKGRLLCAKGKKDPPGREMH